MRQMNTILKRFTNSLKTRGILKTISLAAFRVPAIYLSKLEDYSFDIIHGTDTMGKTPVDQLDVSGESVVHGTGYQPTRARPFRIVMRTLKLPHESVFVDFGSGKGRMLLVASEFGFKRIVGVEFSGELCRTAANNLAVYRKRGGRYVDTQIVHLDAAKYTIQPDENVFFFSNPFDEFLMGVLLDNIVTSYRLYPRKIWLVYMNPVHAPLIERTDSFVQIKRFHFAGPGRDFIVYTTLE